MIFPVGWFEVEGPLPPPVNLWIRGAQDRDCVSSVHCLSLCLSLFFHCHFHGAMSLSSSILFLFEGISKISRTPNTIARALVANSALLQGSNAYSLFGVSSLKV
jgi:hypothetical protein